MTKKEAIEIIKEIKRKWRKNKIRIEEIVSGSSSNFGGYVIVDFIYGTKKYRLQHTIVDDLIYEI